MSSSHPAPGLRSPVKGEVGGEASSHPAPGPRSPVNSARGLFIVLEGIEGCGKSTVAAMLAERLRGEGRAVVLSREPGGTEVGERIRREVLHGLALTAETELLLVLAARADHVERVVRPALERGDIVVCDRFELSSLAYQGAGRELGMNRVRALNAFATGQLRADLTIVLDVATDVAAARTGTRAGPDRIEGEGEAFHARVAEAYRLLACDEPGVVTVDANGPADAVLEAVAERLMARFPETFPRGSG